MVDRAPDGQLPPTHTNTGEQAELSLLRATNVLLANRKLVVLLPLVFGLLIALITILGPRKFVATSILAPEGAGSKASPAASLAAQFGVSVPSAAGSGESATFYKTLLTSQEVLLLLAHTKFELPADGEQGKRSGNLIELYDVEGDTENSRQFRTLKHLWEAVVVTVDDASNTLTVKTTAESPSLAMQMNHRLLQLADQYNGDRRRSRAGSERRFLEERLANAKSDLGGAEARLQAFHTRNRNYASSPVLVLEQARLQRNVMLQQEIYVSLQKSYEQARIDEVRNTPVLSVLSRADVLTPMPRGTVIKTLLGMILGFMIAAAIAFTRTSMDRKRLNREEEYERFVELRRAAISEALRVVPRGMRGQYKERALEPAGRD